MANTIEQTIQLSYNGKQIGVKTMGEKFNNILCTDGRKYKESRLTELCYDINTPDNLCNTIDSLLTNRKRVVLNYGNVETGESWNEIHDIKGRIGRSTGIIKIPLLVYNTRSLGGGAVLDKAIIEIKESVGGRVIYSVTPPPPTEINQVY